jgi:hypothetical protein
VSLKLELIANTEGSIDSIIQPCANASSNSHCETRRGPIVPGSSSLKHNKNRLPPDLKTRASPTKMLISVAPAGLEQMFFECGVPVAQGTTTAPPPTMAEIEKLLEIALRYGIEIKLPKH